MNLFYPLTGFWGFLINNGPSFWGFLISGGPSPFVLFGSAIIAFASLHRNAELTRKRATLDLIEKTESSPYYKTLDSAFYYQVKKGFDDESLYNPIEENDKSHRRKIQQFLNHYEVTAIGIRSKMLDEEFYKNWMQTVFVRDWNHAAEYIQRDRWRYDTHKQKWFYQNTLYEHFQYAACRWSTKAIVLNDKTSGPPEKPTGISDKLLPKTNKHRTINRMLSKWFI